MKEIKIWFKLTANSFQQILSNRSLVLIFMIGKLSRIAIFLLFLIFLFKGAKGIGGYDRNQIIFFYLSFNLIDTLAQFFFREVYRFRALIIAGGFDFVLTKPLNPLIRVLLGGADALDFFTLLILTGITLWFGINFISGSLINWIVFLLLIINGLIIAAALHIFVLGFGIITTTVDHLILVYRDFTSLLRIPVDIYKEPIRSFLTFILPLGIMITFPPKSLMGLLSLEFILISLAFSGLIFVLAIIFWNYSLKYYQSASS